MTDINIYRILAERGFIYQSTDAAQLEARLQKEPITFYVGFDPTADSLHVGHLLPVMVMRWMAKAGHQPIMLVGGGTAMVGDPSGKTEARPIIDYEKTQANAEAIKTQLQSLFPAVEDNQPRMVNNADWLTSLNYIDFLRNYGRLVSVNRMLATESVKQRLETGLTFLEFNYMLLQAYDYVVLNQQYNCELQMGGQDQWGNIVAGIDLVRRVNRRESYGLTFPLLLKSDGEKFGKTASGTVWLSPERTGAFDYYQFWRNCADADTGKLMAYFTELPMEEVNRLSALQPPAINRAKEILAYEATQLVHGSNATRDAWLAAGKEFGFADPEGNIETSSKIGSQSADTGNAEIPGHALTAEEAGQKGAVLNLMTVAGLSKSKSEARRLIRGGGCYINDQRVEDENSPLPEEIIKQGEFILRSGKRNRRRIVISG